MNILTDHLPDEIECDGILFPIKTDFRVWIKFDLLLDSNVPIIQKVIDSLGLCLDLDRGTKIPSSADATMLALSKFYAGNKIESDTKHAHEDKKQRLYCFERDADYIFSAFLSQYGIDLNKIDYLHWWKFKAMFLGLDETHTISKIMQYRAADVSKIKDKETARFYRKMKNMYTLKRNTFVDDSAIFNAVNLA